MDNKDNIQNHTSNENDVKIEVNEADNEVHIQNSIPFPKIPGAQKDSYYTGEKIKEKHGKFIKRDLSINDININSMNNLSINNNLNSMNSLAFNISNYNSMNQSFHQNTTNNDPEILRGKEESLQQVIRVSLSDLYKNPPVNNDQRVLKTQVPKSLEDWIENHSKKALEKPISPETPPSYIPVLETTEDLDEIITPKRSVSCRARNHNTTIRQVKSINQSQTLFPPITASLSHSKNNSISSRKHQLSRNTPMIHISEHDHYPYLSQGNISIDTESFRRLQKGIPKYQVCSHKHCEFIATDKCEKCLEPLCLNHMKRFYYTLQMFSGKSLCINCFRKMARNYLWLYLSIGILASVVLIVLIISSEFRSKVGIINQCIIYFILSVIVLAAFILAHLCSTLATSN